MYNKPKLALPFSENTRMIVRFATGLLTGMVGIADMLSAVVPKLNWDILLGMWPIVAYHSAQKLTVVVGFFLVMLSYGLMRGKYQAWTITLGLLILSFFLHILRGGSVLATLAALSLTIVLALLFRYFQARSDPPSVKRGYVVLVLGLSIVVLYTIGGFIALSSEFEEQIDRFGVEGVIVRLLTNAHLHLSPGTQALLFEHALQALSISAILYGMISILRPVTKMMLPNEEERRAVASNTHMFGKNSISYFALSEEKSYFFSTSRKVVIAYVLVGSVAVVAGDPIGPESELTGALQEFKAFCSQQDWTAVFWQVRNDLVELYRESGMHLLKIGEDAVINTQTFTLKGGAMANVRSSAKRAEKEGLQVVFYRGPVHNSEQLAQMERISQRWVAQKGECEMGFSMGQFNSIGDHEHITAVAVDRQNLVHAFVTFIPIYGRNGWGLDLMRRAERCAPGTMELVLSRSIEFVKSCGAEMVSLGLAPLSNANHEDTSLLENGIDVLTHRFGNLKESQSLFNFKKKFQPTWESRYLVFSHTLTLPQVGWALYKAHQQDATLLRTIRGSIKGWVKGYESIKGKVTTGTLEVLAPRSIDRSY
ncbi:MAG TPA: phosphatidylglycerol lysyltransferase domain-containing protein [Ktedonobacteraceae bacterium]|nr:phosphatidylglycerol lysyltransferase domain-containing protein [Ktedonobacteraceae bacterium]